MEEKKDTYEETPLTPAQELDQMRNEIESESMRLYKVASSFLKRGKDDKNPVTKEEREQQKSAQDDLNNMRKMYDSLYKVVYPKGSKQTNTETGKPNMAKVHSMKSTMSSIVANTEVKAG